MEKQKKGISLIVLVITIIVMIILASAIIITLSNTNIITKAREAVLKTDVKNFEQELSLTLADEKLANKDLDMTSVNATSLEEIQKYIPSFDEKYLGKVYIQNGEVVYDETLVTADEEEALESIGIKSGKIYTPAEIKAIIESKNLANTVSTTDITPYVEGLSKADAEKYTIFRGELYYRYEKTTFEEQLELHAAEISILMGDANENGTLDEEDVLILGYYEGGLDTVEYTKNIVYMCDFDQDFIITSTDGTNVDYILVNDYKMTDLISIENQNPEKIRLVGDYALFYDHMTHYYPGISIPNDLNTTDYAVMKQYYSDMTEEQGKKFAIADGQIVYKYEALTDNEKVWVDELAIPYI